jgi:two-component system response regulator AtoC
VRILIIDDHRNTREAIALALTQVGFEVDTAASGFGAMGLLDSHRYDWIVCDVRMPGMSGIELATQARAVQPAAGVVVMTAYDVSSDDRRRLAEIGAGLLIKPVTADDLMAYWSASLQESSGPPRTQEADRPLS